MDLPVGARLDAILNRIDASGSESDDGDFDYEAFVKRRAQQHSHGDASASVHEDSESDPEPDTLEQVQSGVQSGVQDSDPVSDEEIVRDLLRTPQKPMNVPSPRRVSYTANGSSSQVQSPQPGKENEVSQSPSTPNRNLYSHENEFLIHTSPLLRDRHHKPSQEQESPKNLGDRKSQAHNEGHESPDSPDSQESDIEQTHSTPAETERQRILDQVYADAGIEQTEHPMKAPERPKTSKRALEEKARQDQRLERLLDRDIGHHTVQQATVASFLDDLNSSSPPPKPDQHGSEPDIVFSSPPRMPRLQSYVVGHRNDAGSSWSSDDDDDLEIVPETATMRRPAPVRKMLQLAGPAGGTGNAQAALIARLQAKQKQQVREKRTQHIQRLREQGIDVEAATEVHRERETLLEAEQRRALEAKDGESDWSDDGLSDLDAEPMEFSGSDSESDSAIQVVKRGPKVLDDDDDADNADNADNADAAAAADDGNDSNNAENIKSPHSEPGLASVRTVTGTAPPAEAQATQWAPPLQPELQAQMFADDFQADEPTSTDASEDLEDTQNDTQRDSQKAAEDINSDKESGQEHPNIDHNDHNSDQDDIPEVGPARPDLSDLPGTGLTPSQELHEVRKRFLAAQKERELQELRRQDEARRRFVEAEAEESEDEYAGMGGDENEDEDLDGELEGLVDDSEKVDTSFGGAQQLWVDQQRREDEHMVNNMVRNIHGGWRRRYGAGGAASGFLSDDDDEIAREEEEEQWRREREKRRRSKMLETNSRVAQLASSERTRAFVDSISEDLARRPAKPVTTVVDEQSFEETFSFLKPQDGLTDEDSDQDPASPSGDPLGNSLSNRAGSERTIETGQSTNTREQTHLGTSVLPRPVLSLRSNLPKPRASRTSTYASRVAAIATESGGSGNGAKHVEILRSLGSKSRKARSNKAFVAPSAPPTKTRRVLPTTSAAGGLFKRSWA